MKRDGAVGSALGSCPRGRQFESGSRNQKNIQMSQKTPEEIMTAKEMRKKLGTCHSCVHAAETLDKCKQNRPAFENRFRFNCIHLEHNPNWYK